MEDKKNADLNEKKTNNDEKIKNQSDTQLIYNEWDRRNYYYNPKDKFQYFDDFETQEFEEKFLVPYFGKNAYLEEKYHIQDAIENEESKNNIEVLDKEDEEKKFQETRKFIFSKKNKNKDSSSGFKLNEHSQRLIDEEKRKIPKYKGLTESFDVPEEITNFFNEKEMYSYKKMSKNYKDCMDLIVELINLFRSNGTEYFYMNEEDLRNIYESKIFKIKYEFRNWASNNENLYTKSDLCDKIIECSKQFEKEYDEILRIKSSFENYLKDVEQIKTKRDRKKMIKKYKIEREKFCEQHNINKK